MNEGSYTSGLLGLVGGILLALLAILVGHSVARMMGPRHIPTAAHEAH